MADLLDYAARAVDLARRAGATSSDALAIDSADMNASIRHGVPETIERAESRGIGLRVFVGQSSANLSTSELSDAALTELAEKAVAIARVAPADPFAGLADASLLATDTPDLDLADSSEPSMEALQQRARETETIGRDAAGITNSEGADAGFGRTRVALATSTGFTGSYRLTRHSLSVSLIAGTGERMQRDYDYTVTTHASDLASPEAVGREAARRTLERLDPRKVDSQQAPVFFEPRVARSLLSAFAGAISGASVARGTSFLKDALGSPVFAEGITITDDPLRPRGLASHGWDAEGVAARPRALVDRGVLTTWLLDCRSARQLGLATTGHASRGLSGPPHPASTNLYIEPGAATPQQLLQQFGSGLYVTETIGHGTNLLTGDFSVGASGFWIEGGARAYPVSEVTIAGNLRDMFRTLVAANDLQFIYATNAPTLVVPSMTIAGN